MFESSQIWVQVRLDGVGWIGEIFHLRGRMDGHGNGIFTHNTQTQACITHVHTHLLSRTHTECTQDRIS